MTYKEVYEEALKPKPRNIVCENGKVSFDEFYGFVKLMKERIEWEGKQIENYPIPDDFKFEEEE